MRISLADLNYYRDTLHGIGSQASEYVRDAIQSSGARGVTAMREAAIEAIQDSVGIHGEMAQALAGQLFDEVCAAEGIEVGGFELYDGIIDFDMLEEKVRWFARYLVEHDGGDRFLDDCGQLAEFYARRCNWESMVRNCEGNHVMFARVPTGAETCDFCMMLASRGFAYYTREAAEHGMHAHCDCIVVCGGPSTVVEGYDPKTYYDLWTDMVGSKAESRAKRKGTTAKTERASIMAAYERSSARAKRRNKMLS